MAAVRIPPPLVASIAAAAMWWIARITPTTDVSWGVSVAIAVALFAAGLFVIVSGVVSFRQARTTVNPLRPETATSLVTSGVFRYTRNPIYLGMLLLLLGWSAFLGSVASVAGVFAFVAYINHFQIRSEEAALTKLFGANYLAYTRRVRRWL